MSDNDNQYVRNPDDSWHIFKTWTRMPGRALTVCDQSIDNSPEVVDMFPMGEKTCETCFRLVAS